MSSVTGSGGVTPIQIPQREEAQPASQVSTPAVATQAPMSSTMPAPPSEAALSGAVRRQSGSEAPVSAASVRASLSADVTASTTPSRAAQRTETLNISADSLKKSADAGVDTAKRSFFGKLASTVVGGVVAGLAAALTVVTAGAAAPLLALACVNLAVCAGDARCSYHNYKNAVAVSQGKPETNPKMPMGNSCIDNCIHSTLTFCGVKDSTAKTAATWVGPGVSLGLGITAMLISGGATQATAALELATVVTKSCGAAVKLGLATVGKLIDRSAAAKLEKAMDADSLRKTDVQGAHDDPEGLQLAEDVLAPLGTSKPVMAHSKASDQAGALRNGLGAAATIAKVTGVATIIQAGGMSLFNMIRG
jgi:hypothetical protein